LLVYEKPHDAGRRDENGILGSRRPRSWQAIQNEFSESSEFGTWNVWVVSGIFGEHTLTWLSQITVPVTIKVHPIPVEYDPDANLGLGAEDEQAILRMLRLIARLLDQGPLDFAEIGGRGRGMVEGKT